MNQPWFERWPDLKAEEEARFEAHQFPWREDPELLEQGYLAVDTEVQFRGEPLEIKVIYPSEYPELPPHVRSEPVLSRHQQPFQGDFCLLDHPIESWTPYSWGAADLIHFQLLTLLANSEAGEDVVREHEAPMPEPVSAYFRYEPNTVVIVPGELASPSGGSGRFALREFDGGRFLLTQVDNTEATEQLVGLLPLKASLGGRWKRLDQLPDPLPGPTGEELKIWVEAEHAELLPTKPPPLPPKKRNKRRKRAATRHLVGLVFPEERSATGETKDTWFFLDVHLDKARLLHTQELSEEERLRRIPDLAGLGDKRALIIGAGSLGGDVALHLGRANVGTLKIVDFDRMEVNNSVRHALGVEWAGVLKAYAIALACQRANPFCSAEAAYVQFGDIHPGHTPLASLEQLVDEADIVVETTGIHQIEHLVGRVAWEQRKPIVSCWLTNGSWAGEVVRLIPTQTMCMTCFQKGQRDRKLLLGDAGPDETPISVQGCSHPTVGGAGFDAAETAAMAARLAVQALLPGDDYPRPEWDHAVANFRRPPEDKESARFAAEKLPPNEECSVCGRDAG
ncbi:MAG TPA: ThiF family adenylyltransferase [Solirubrobacterales bacterium]|nr:ThiF family adenylyltransferase [Solirubrobacterales bacterium]